MAGSAKVAAGFGAIGSVAAPADGFAADAPMLREES